MASVEQQSPRLVVSGTDSVPGRVIELRQSHLTVGRAISNDIQLSDEHVSRKRVRRTRDVGRYRG